MHSVMWTCKSCEMKCSIMSHYQKGEKVIKPVRCPFGGRMDGSEFTRELV